MLPPLPRCSSWVYSSLFSPSRISLPRFHGRVGLHIVLFEVCSAFTHVAACTLAQSPIRDRYPGASDISSPPCLLRLLPAEANRRVGLAPTGKRRLVTAQRPVLYYQISISYGIISKFWPIWPGHLASPVRELPPAVPTYALCRSASAGSGCKRFCRRSHRSSPRRYPSPAENCSN